jgi:hypothetical protein
MSRRILIEFPEATGNTDGTVGWYDNVVGHALVLVTKLDDGGLDVSRVIGVNADSAEDNQIVGDFIKKVEDKLAEIFEPEKVPEAKLWVPE